ncbi:MAG TPA: hemerythrin domain-containing protein [Bryobacteraceae bacterium]|nr:hemerythrin domain-containing protein [Bryobacteraceae bacterium]
MQQTNPIHELTAEHRVIEKAAALMEKMADQLTSGSGVDGSVLQNLVQFLRVYADELHHGKEEAILFPALEAKGVPQAGCPLGGLVAEHRKGRTLVDELIRASGAYEENAASAREELIASLRALRELYNSHIWKEDNLLFPLAEKLLAGDDSERVKKQFLEVDERIGTERIRKLTGFADQLDRHAGS